MKNKNKVMEGYLLVTLAGACWGLMGVLTRELGVLGYNSIEISSMRAIVAAVFYAIICFIKDRKCFKTDLKGLLFFAFYGIVTLDGMFLSFTYAIEKTSIATASVLLFTNPIMVMIMSYFFFGEKFTKQKVVALSMALLGCFLLVKGYDTAAFKVNLQGILWGVTAGFTVALQNVIGKVAVQKYNYRTHLVYSFLFAAIFLSFFSSPVVVLAKTVSLKHVLFVLAIGILATVIPNAAFVKALQYIESGQASIFSSVEPIVATLLGFIIFKETLELPQMMGIIFIVLAVVFIQKGSKNEELG